MTPEDPPRSTGAPRRFYEDLAGRALDPSTVRGITYRNCVVAKQLAGRELRIRWDPGRAG
jgi:hypothetical protein